MKYLKCLVWALTALSSVAATAASPYEGSAWSISIVRSEGEAPSPACIVFHPGGRFTMSDRSTTMLWDTHPQFPYVFNAVSAPGDTTVVNTPIGVHGYLTWGNKMLGSGVDANGYAFKFQGAPIKSCGDTEAADGQALRNERPATDAGLLTVSNPTAIPCAVGPCGQPGRAVERTQSSSDAVLQTFVNETQNIYNCQKADCTPKQPGGLTSRDSLDAGLLTYSDSSTLVNPCSESWCAPPDHLLGLDVTKARAQASQMSTSKSTRSQLLGNMYAFEMTDIFGNSSKHCWYFGADRTITSYHGDTLLWVSDDLLTSSDRGFQSVGTDAKGQGIAVQGATWDEELLYVQGIRAFNKTAVMTYGWGRLSSDCNFVEDPL